MKTVKKKFQGRSMYRYRDNPLEEAFALAWQERNDTGTKPIGHSLLDYMLDKENKGYPDPPTSKRDWEVANTVIQWLGSPVGQSFLIDVIEGNSKFRSRLQQAGDGN